MLIDLLESSKVIGLCPNQEEILKQVLNGRDILFCSPAGSGKSIIFEVAPFAFHFLGQMKSCCTVVSPLAALMKSKAQELKLRGTNVIYLPERQPNTTNSDYLMKTSDIVTDLQNGMFELIFASPETLLESYREVMLQLAKTGFLFGYRSGATLCRA